MDTYHPVRLTGQGGYHQRPRASGRDISQVQLRNDQVQGQKKDRVLDDSEAQRFPVVFGSRDCRLDHRLWGELISPKLDCFNFPFPAIMADPEQSQSISAGMIERKFILCPSINILSR